MPRYSFRVQRYHVHRYRPRRVEWSLRRGGDGLRGRWVFIGLMTVALLAAWLVAAGARPPGSDEPAVFADEFHGSALDRSRWQSGYHWGDTNEDNAELQCYSPDALAVGGGVLRITAQRERARCNDEIMLPYTSGMVTTYSSFAQTHGYFEMRAKLPAGQGLWPAFWLLPRTTGFPPEIDVVEHLGDDPHAIHMHFHHRDADGALQSTGADWSGPDFTEDFHRFAVSWDEDAIIWFVDGVERFRVTENIPEEPMYLLINLAVGGDWPGDPDESTTFPSVMEIDYVRVWDDPGIRPQ